MALAATIVWEVRATNANSADNGGGFNSAAAGTDYSIQNNAQVIIDNVAITCTTPGANSNTLTFTLGYTPSSADVGNLVSITAGTNINAGVYEITGQSSTTWTLTGAQNLTTAGGAGLAITGRMGGARTGLSTGTTAMTGVMLAGHKVWVKNEAWNESVTFSVSGSATAPIKIEGYNSSRGDAPTGANIPTNDRATVGIPFLHSAGGYIIKYIRARRSSAAGFSSASNNIGVTFVGCRSDTNTTAGWARTANSQLFTFIGCEADTNTTAGFDNNGTQPWFLFGSYSHDNTTIGMALTGQAVHQVINCIIESNSSHGISISTGQGTYIGNTIDSNTGGSSDGFLMTTPGGSVLPTFIVMNNIFSNNGRYGTNATNASLVWEDYNNYYLNGTAARNPSTASAGGWGPATNDQVLDPQYTNAAGGDFTIGTNLKAKGWPGLFPG